MSSAQFAKHLSALKAAQRLLCRGFPQEETRGPGALMKFGPLQGLGCSAAGCKKCSTGTKTGSGEKEPFAEEIMQIQEIVVAKKIITSGWCKTSSFGEALATRQWLCEGCHSPSCSTPPAPSRSLNKPNPTQTCSLN